MLQNWNVDKSKLEKQQKELKDSMQFTYVGHGTKATGLAALCGLVGIQPREVMAFGDNFNDQPMLDWVGRPYVMRGADPALRALYPAADRPEPVIEALLNALE